MTTSLQQETATSFGPGPVGTSQVSPLACCHWARLALANFFFTFRVQELTMFTPPQKKVVKTPP